MGRKKIFAMILVILTAGCSKNPSQPQEGGLRGTATFEGQEDHSGIVVKVQELGRQTITAAGGDYSFSSIPAGSYTLWASDGDTVRHLFDFATLRGISVVQGRESLAPAIELSRFQRIESDIVGQEHWAADEGPYLITRSVTVQTGGQLTVAPGTIIKFEGYFRLNILGSLIAKGTAVDSIVITGMNLRNSPGQWDRISLQGSGKDPADSLIYCRIEYANIGLACYQSAPVICQNIICQCSGYGLVSTASTLEIRENLITKNYGGISCENGTAGILQANIIAENITAGIACARSSPEICDNIISNNQLGLQAQSESDPLVWHNQFTANEDAVYSFYYCDPRIEANEFIDQQRYAFCLVGYNNPLIQLNNVTGNGSYLVYLNDQPRDVRAPSNWWGTPEPNEISTLVWDRQDDYRLGQVLLDPLLTAPVDSAGPRISP